MNLYSNGHSVNSRLQIVCLCIALFLATVSICRGQVPCGIAELINNDWKFSVAEGNTMTPNSLSGNPADWKQVDSSDGSAKGTIELPLITPLDSFN